MAMQFVLAAKPVNPPSHWATMVITLLEGRLAPGRGPDIEGAYREIAANLPPGIVESFLVKDGGDPLLYRIITVWTGRPALEAMRDSGETPKGIQVFQAAGATPVVSLLEVVEHRKQAGPGSRP